MPCLGDTYDDSGVSALASTIAQGNLTEFRRLANDVGADYQCCFLDEVYDVHGDSHRHKAFYGDFKILSWAVMGILAFPDEATDRLAILSDLVEWGARPKNDDEAERLWHLALSHPGPIAEQITDLLGGWAIGVFNSLPVRPFMKPTYRKLVEDFRKVQLLAR